MESSFLVLPYEDDKVMPIKLPEKAVVYDVQFPAQCPGCGSLELTTYATQSYTKLGPQGFPIGKATRYLCCDFIRYVEVTPSDNDELVVVRDEIV